MKVLEMIALKTIVSALIGTWAVRARAASLMILRKAILFFLQMVLVK